MSQPAPDPISDLHIARARLQWRKAEIGIGKAGVEAREKEGAYTVTLDEADIELPDLPIAGRAVVLMDDVASSGHTVAQAAHALLRAGAASVDVAVTHALFAAGAIELLRNAGVDQVWSTDASPHASNAVSIVPMVAQALLPLLAR